MQHQLRKRAFARQGRDAVLAGLLQHDMHVRIA